MKKFFHTVYLLGISVILFGCLLAVTKDFDILHLMNTTIGIAILVIMFAATFAVIFIYSDDEKKIKKVDTEESYYFKKYEIKKQIIDEFLSNVINSSDETKVISHTMQDRLLTIDINVKKIEKVNVIILVEELRKKIESELEEKFGIKDEITLKFNVVEEEIKIEAIKYKNEEEPKEVTKEPTNEEVKGEVKEEEQATSTEESKENTGEKDGK
ncbi:hypothetical protein F6Y05_38495 [Bacillus megaterium]|nr:hypothetical protein [Priestia megaterium]